VLERCLLAVAAMIQQPRWAEMCARILQQCEHLQGGRGDLAAFLGVREAELAEWLAARSGPPRAVFERAMELILAEHDRRAAREAAGVPKRRRTDRAAV
jgi:hypothetical protein